MVEVKMPPKILLKSARTNTGLSAKEVGEVIDRIYQTILKYEEDSTNIPISLLNSLSDFYQYPKDFIFLGKTTEYKRYKKGRRNERTNKNHIKQK